MKRIELKYCKTAYTDKLYRNLLLANDVTSYSEQTFEIDDEFCGSTGIYIAEDLNLNPNDSDYVNSLKLYSALRNLTEIQASDERLWTYLSHQTFWAYMRSRWPLEKANNPINRIKDRYFMRSLTLRGLTRNGISRLWWYAHLTLGKDDSKKNLLEILLSRQDLVVGITERALGSSENIRYAILEYLQENPHVAKNEDATRILLTNISLIGGVKILPLLSISEIKDQLYKL